MAQWLERPTVIGEVMDLIPTWNSEIFLVLPSLSVKQSSFTSFFHSYINR